MKPRPEVISGETLICYSPIDERHRFTGNCKQIVAGQVLGPMAGLMICYYEKDGGFYLFGCDADWRVKTDTWHETLDEAKSQAEFEYEGISNTWIDAA